MSGQQQKVTGVSDQLRERLQANAASLQNGARNAAGVASVVLLLALMAGAAVVIGPGLYLFYRERRLGKSTTSEGVIEGPLE